MDKLLIKNGLLYTMNGEHNAPFYGDLLTVGGKVAAVGQVTEGQAEGARVIDARGLHVLPGLIDAHSHIGIMNLSGIIHPDDANEMTDPVTADMDAVYGTDSADREFATCRENGITSLMITPGSGNVVCGLAFAVKTAPGSLRRNILKRPCALKIALGGNPIGTYGGKGKTPMTRMGVAAVLRNALEKARAYGEKLREGNCSERDTKLEPILSCLRGEIPLKIHCTQHDIGTAIEIAREFGIRFTLDHAWGAEDYIDEIAESGCGVCFGPGAGHRFPGERRSIEFAPVRDLDARGVCVALITDAPLLSAHSLIHHAGEAVRAGVSHWRALRMITINPAEIMGIADHTGSLELGKDADLALFSARPALDTDARAVCTVIGGEVAAAQTTRLY